VGYAKIEDGRVVTVLVVTQEDSDEHGAAFLTDILGLDGYWVQVCDNMEPIHYNFASAGNIWDEAAQAFYSEQPFPSFVMDDDFKWVNPVPYPADDPATEPFYSWDEDTTSWVEVE
jgi:hypothetical protein